MMARRDRLGELALGALGALLAACGGTVTTGGGGGGGAGGQGPGLCETYLDQTSDDGAPRPTTVRLVNLRASDVFLGDPTQGCYGYVPFSLAQGGEAVEPRLGGCQFTCETMMSGQCSCPAICEQPQIVRLAPGGTYELTWGGFDYLPAQLPSECNTAGCSGECFIPRYASGLYEVTGTAYPELDCGGGDCTCEPDASGACVVDGAAAVAGAPITTSVTYDYASTVWELELVFE